MTFRFGQPFAAILKVFTTSKSLVAHVWLCGCCRFACLLQFIHLSCYSINCLVCFTQFMCIHFCGAVSHQILDEPNATHNGCNNIRTKWIMFWILFFFFSSSVNSSVYVCFPSFLRLQMLISHPSFSANVNVNTSFHTTFLFSFTFIEPQPIHRRWTGASSQNQRHVLKYD